jgi:hypothetical protein
MHDSVALTLDSGSTSGTTHLLVSEIPIKEFGGAMLSEIELIVLS